MRIVVSDAVFDAGAELDRFTAAAAGAGGVVSFTGLVRDENGTLSRMQIEHYPGMTERAIRDMAQTAAERWDLTDVLVIHRYGDLAPGEQIMMVATAARHRRNAFDAADYLMDYLKSRAPFWKKEFGTNGSDWVAAKDEDEDALSRW